MATESFISPLVEEIKQDLSIRCGETVLAVARSWKQHGYSSGHNSFPYFLQEELYLGIITQPFLSYHPGKLFGDLEIHTSEHSFNKEWLHRDKVYLKKGSIMMRLDNLDRKLGSKSKVERFFYDHFPEPDFPTHNKIKDEDEDKLALEIISGNQNVTDWFVNDVQYGKMGSCYKEILAKHTGGTDVDSREDNYIKEIHLRLDVFVLIGYQKMRAALGLTQAILPMDLEEKVNLKISKIRLKAVENIEKLIKDGELIQDKQSDLPRAVKRAIELGLHLEPWIITREIISGMKIEIDVPVFINNLAQHLKIPLEENKE